ncbi:unconventional myosin-X-like [Scleropages formosus]|uniref:Unconventional myosin-X-like n=1 Tax=Scleropages formosus TaxID=113540 RepID=A0A0P7X612_SCLFO|nr:unconventional myosin-X-like [Scleropages formosus]
MESPQEVTVCQPSRTANGVKSQPDLPEEMRGLNSLTKSDKTEKSQAGLEWDSDFGVKGWLYREVRGSWIRQRRHWFVLTEDSLDHYSGHEKGSRQLGSLVLTSLCSVIWPDKQTYKETGYWSITIYGRKHCYRLYTKHFNEATHWACAIQKVIDGKAPVETPTQLLIRDIEKNKSDLEVVEQIYQQNPILRYTQSPLYAPLLPFPYGGVDHTYHNGKGYSALRDEAVKLFHSLQQLEVLQDPVALIQGMLQTCLDLHPLRDEVYCQLVKQTTGTDNPNTPVQLRYWQLLTCMSCTFLPGLPVLSYLQFHLKRVQRRWPGTEADSYASFIRKALEKTRCRELVPSWEEIRALVRRREMLCTVHHPGPGSCQLPISSHTTADELVMKMLARLGLQESRNTFALFERSVHREQVVGGSTIVADILTKFQNLSAKEPESDAQRRLYFKLYCFLDMESISSESVEYIFLFEQCHEMMVRGHLPTSEEDLQALAALRLQTLIGDFTTHSPCPPLDELFPRHVVEARILLTPKSIQPPGDAPAVPHVVAPGGPQCFCSGFRTLWGHAAAAAHKQKAEQDLRLRSRLKEEGVLVMGAIMERWKGLAGYSQQESMATYLSIAKRWPGFGCTLYDVEFYISSTGSFCQKLWLGVSAQSLCVYKQGEPEPLETFPYSQISSYGASDSSTFKVATGDCNLLFETSKLREIVHLINAYFRATRHRGGQEPGAEMEGGVGSESRSPSKGNT